MLNLTKNSKLRKQISAKVFFLLVFILFVETTVKAQIDNNRFTVDVVSEDLGPCGGTNDALTTVGVFAKNNSVNNFEIIFDLPDGVTYDPSSAAIIPTSGGSVDFTLTEVDISNLNAPIFRLEKLAPTNANWNVSENVSFTFSKTATCDAVQFSYNGGLFKDAHTITYDDMNGPQTASDNDPTINSYNFLTAYLSVGNYNSVSADIGENITRTLEVTNAGNGNTQNFVQNVIVENEIGAYVLSFIDLGGTRHALTPNSTTPVATGTLYSYFIDLSVAPFFGNIGNGDALLENEIVFLEESFDVLGCDETTIGHQPTWGCSLTEICQVPLPVSAEIVLDLTSPIINVTRVTGTHDDFCNTATHSVIISNDATTAEALSLRVNLGFSLGSSIYTSDTANGLWGNDHPTYNTKAISNFRFSGGTPFTIPQRANTQTGGVGNGSYFIGDNFFPTTGPDPDGPGGLEDLDGDGFYDDLAPGASTEIFMDSDITPRSAVCGNTGATDFVDSVYLHTDAYAQSQCGEIAPTDRVRLQYTLLRRYSSSTDGPTDIYDGQFFDLNVKARLYSASDEVPYCNGTRPFSNDPSSSYTVTLTVPNGITLAGTPAGYSQPDPNTIIFTTQTMPSSNILLIDVDFPVTFSCGAYAGPKNVPISYSVRYQCDCFDEEVNCGTFGNVRSQCASPCDGPNITEFSAERETAGWTDATMTTPVVLDPLTHNLKTYMAKDEMVVRTKGVMSNSNPTELYFDLTYNTPGGIVTGGSDIIQFVGGTIVINDLSSGAPTAPINLSPPVVNTNGTTTHHMMFDLSSYTTNISPTYTYGEPLLPAGAPEADEVELELHFVFKEDFTDRNLFELQNFSGDFYTYDLLMNRVSCNILGDRAFYFKNYARPYDQPSTTATGCNPALFYLLWNLQSIPGDAFPNEFRPPVIWHSSVVEIPPGAEFTGTVTSHLYPGSPSTANGGLNASLVGNTLTITPGATFLNVDQNSTLYPRLYVQLLGSSASAPATPFNWTVNWDEYAYSSAPVTRTMTNGNSLRYTSPNYTLNAAEPVISGDQVNATYEVDLCMNFAQDIDFNWLQINNGSDFSIINAYEIVGATQNPLTFTENGGQTWVELGQYASGYSCKKIGFDIAYTQCANLDFVVEHAWDCDDYPADFTSGAYLNPLSLRLEPKEAALQFSILSEPTGYVDVCSSFNIDLELRNAGNGDLIDPVVTFDIPGDATSLALNDITVAYPRGSVPVPVTNTLVGNTVTINLFDHPGIAADQGIRGSLNAVNIDDQIAIIQLDLSVACNFSSNTAITYTANGNNPCGSPANGDGSRASTNPIIVNGAIPNYDAVSNLAVPSGGLFQGCSSETITIETTIVGGPTSSLDYARVILPDGLTLDPSSFTSNNTTYPVTYNALTVVGNHEEFTVQMPDGANNGANPSYSFNVTPKNAINSCTPGARIEVLNYVVTTGLSCGPASCGATETGVGSTFEDIIITKPELAESSFISNADYTTDGAGNYEYQLQFGVENTGSVDIAAGFVYEVYCADPGGNKVGTSIYSGAVAQPIAAGNSINEEIVFTTTSFCGENANMIVEFIPSSTNCHCDVLSIPLISESEMVDLSLSMGLSASSIQNPQVGQNGTMELTLTNSGPATAANVVIENMIPAGLTVDGGSISNGGTLSGSDIIWNIASINSGESLTLSFTFTVNSPSGAPIEYTNTAQVNATDQFDIDSTPDNYTGIPIEDDEATYEVNTQPTVDIEILKIADKADSYFEDVVVFTVTANNIGIDQATNISIEDILPDGFQFDSANTTSGLFDETLGEWIISSLDPSESAELQMTTTVLDATSYTNTATLSFVDQIDINPDNDSASVTINITQEMCLTVFNEFSPNGDGANDVFFIECIEQYPNNMLRIFNRWGIKVFEMQGYDNSWDGTSTGRVTISASEKLPAGTYYYTLDPRDNEAQPKSGWLYISR